MNSLQLILTLLFAFHLIAALEVNKRQNAPIDPMYKLIAKGNDGDRRFDGLEITAYHSFAGAGDAVFTNKTNFSGGFLNDTTPTFIFPDSGYTAFLNLDYNTLTNYDSWLKVTIDAGPNPELYQTAAIVDGKLIYQLSQAVYWKGWLACEWVRLVPQLFFLHYDAQVKIPTNCARIDLLVEYL